MSNWLQPREFDMFPTEEARRAALRSVNNRISFVRYLLSFLIVFGLLEGVMAVLEYALHGFPGGRLGAALLGGGLPGGLTAPTVILLFRRRRALECRRLLCEQGIPVCIHCGYDLRGQTVARCPECGREFDPSLLNMPHPVSPSGDNSGS
jgi:hypothetical protein